MWGSGGCSSVGRVQDCDSCCRGFEPHQPPQYLKSRVPFGTRDFSFGDRAPSATHPSESPGSQFETYTAAMCGKIQKLVAVSSCLPASSLPSFPPQFWE